VRLLIDDELERSRGTVFFRAIFALPFLIWLAVWAVGAAFVAFFHWLMTGRRCRRPANRPPARP
jgi:hypothetical protein